MPLPCRLCRRPMRFLGPGFAPPHTGVQAAEWWECRACKRSEAVLLDRDGKPMTGADFARGQRHAGPERAG